jgi:hypothetical protein
MRTARDAWRACDVVAGGGVQGWPVAGLGLFGLQPGHVNRSPCRHHGRAALLGVLNPGRHIGGAEGRQGHRSGQWLGHGIDLAHQGVQRDLLDAQVVFGSNFLRNHQVKAGLGFAAVGDGGSAHLEVALGRCQLLGHGRFLCAHKRQRVLGGEHIKVGLAQADDEVLRGCAELRLGLRQLPLGLVERGPVGRAEQRLGRAGRDVLVAKGPVHHRVAVVKQGARHAGAQIGRRQQSGACLLGPCAVGVVLGLGRLPGGVVGPRQFVKVDQALGLGLNGESAGERGSEGQKPQMVHGIPSKDCKTGLDQYRDTCGSRSADQASMPPAMLATRSKPFCTRNAATRRLRAPW